MHTRTFSPFLGIEEICLEFSAAERKTLERAADILASARTVVGEETDLGVDLGKGEVILRDYINGAVIADVLVPVSLNELLSRGE